MHLQGLVLEYRDLGHDQQTMGDAPMDHDPPPADLGLVVGRSPPAASLIGPLAPSEESSLGKGASSAATAPADSCPALEIQRVQLIILFSPLWRKLRSADPHLEPPAMVEGKFGQ